MLNTMPVHADEIAESRPVINQKVAPARTAEDATSSRYAGKTRTRKAATWAAVTCLFAGVLVGFGIEHAAQSRRSAASTAFAASIANTAAPFDPLFDPPRLANAAPASASEPASAPGSGFQLASIFGGHSGGSESSGGGAGAASNSDRAPSTSSRRETAIVHLARQVSPAVVSVGALRTTYEADPFFRDFYMPFFATPRLSREPFLGSGFIINKSGYIVTNLHVIEGAEQIFVTLTDGRELNAKLLDADRFTDVALLRVESTGLPSIELGDSDSLMIGETIVALGNPFGNFIEDPRPTVTVGVVSALNRSFRPDPSRERIYLDMIQTDAAINPGNSGGPLVNLDEKVVGMNTFIVSTSGGSMGIGFAIPSSRIRGIADEILKYGRLRPLLRDFFYVTLNRQIAAQIGIQLRPGAIIYEISPGGPAEKAGLQVGDVVVSADGKSVRNASDLRLHIAARQVGDTLRLEVVRGDKSIKITYQISSAEKRTNP